MGYRAHGGGGTTIGGSHGGATSLEIFDSTGTLGVSVKSSDTIAAQSTNEKLALAYFATETVSQPTLANKFTIPVTGDTLDTPSEQNLSTLSALSAETNAGFASQDTFDLVVKTVEINPTPLEEYLATIYTYRDELNNTPVDTSSFVATARPFGDAVVSNTNWTNPTNALGDTTSTAATLSATSSGLAGLTSNTTNGTIILSIADLYTPGTIDLTQFSISSAILSVEYSQVAGSGLGNSSSRTVDYSLNNGTSWASMLTGNSAQAKTTANLNITAQVTSWAQLNNLQIRWTGAVTSGVGSGSTTTTSLFRAWITVTAVYNP